MCAGEGDEDDKGSIIGEQFWRWIVRQVVWQDIKTSNLCAAFVGIDGGVRA